MTAKRHLSPVRLPWLLLPASIVMLGVLITLWLLHFTPNGILFDSNADLDALLTQQIAQQIKSGNFPLDVVLNVPAATWIKSVWDAGLDPFSPDFVYGVGARQFTDSSFVFPLVSAPFYALFGDRGLYIIPLVALWFIWIRFWQIGLRAGWGVGSLCVGLVGLIFASPLTLYGGVFWPHTLAVALSFWGISGLAFPRAVLRTRAQSLIYGVLIGLAGWFGPEFLCVIAIVSFLALLGWLLPKWRLAPAFTASQAIILIGSMACTAGIWFAMNYAIYGHPLGTYAIQSVETASMTEQLVQAKTSYTQIGLALQRYFPIVWVVAIAAIFSPELKQRTVKISPLKNNALKDKKGLYFDRLGLRKTATSVLMPGRFALSLCLLFVLSVPLIVLPGVDEKQWGPRFYLLLIPLLSLVLAEQLRPDFFRRWGRRSLLIGTAIALILGIQLNTINGAFSAFNRDSDLSRKVSYQLTAEAIAALQADSHSLVATSSKGIAQQLWGAFPDKTFFHAEAIAQVKQLADALVEQGEPEFLYLCSPYTDCTVPEIGGNKLNLEDGVHTLNLMYAGDYGEYPAYTVEIVEIITKRATPKARLEAAYLPTPAEQSAHIS